MCSIKMLVLKCRPESPEEAELRQKIEGLKLRVEEGEGEAEIQVPALSSSAAQPNGSSETPQTVSGKEATDMAKEAVEQAASAGPPKGSDEGAASQADASSSEPTNGSAEAAAPTAAASAATSKPVSAWSKKPSLLLQTTVQQHLADCEGKLKQLSTRLDAEARQASQQPSSTAAPAPTSRPPPSRW